jgi:hypothetical protein
MSYVEPTGTPLRGQNGLVDHLLASDQLPLTALFHVAISYAAMIAKWSPERILEELRRQKSCTREAAEEHASEFLDDLDGLNQRQRMIMIAEAYDYEVLVAVEWLLEKHNLDIRCFRLSLASNGDHDLLTCSCVYPPQDITDHAVNRRRRGGEGGGGGSPMRWTNWEDSLAGLANQNIVQFFRGELQAGQEHSLGRKRLLFYRIAGKRSWFVQAHQRVAYVWQYRRFEGDEQFWAKRIAKPEAIQPIRDGLALRFFLETEADFRAFKKAVTSELSDVTFLDEPAEEDTADEEEAEATR